jgi:hypothetical protein
VDEGQNGRCLEPRPCGSCNYSSDEHSSALLVFPLVSDFLRRSPPSALALTWRWRWVQLMRLAGEDMQCVTNLEYLGVAVSKKSSSSAFSLSFGKRKVRRAVQRTSRLRSRRLGHRFMHRVHPSGRQASLRPLGNRRCLNRRVLERVA